MEKISMVMEYRDSSRWLWISRSADVLILQEPDDIMFHQVKFDDST